MHKYAELIGFSALSNVKNIKRMLSGKMKGLINTCGVD